MKRILIAALCIVMTVVVAIGGTLAYLQTKTVTLTNVFTFGNVSIGLADANMEEGETTITTKAQSGQYITRNPLMTVNPNSEESYIYMKVTTSEKFDKFFMPLIINTEDWNIVSSNNGTSVYVYKNTVGTAENAVALPAFLKAGYSDGTTNYQLKVRDNYTSDDVKELDGTNNPTITFTGYAIQIDTAFENATAAWNAVFATPTEETTGNQEAVSEEPDVTAQS